MIVYDKKTKEYAEYLYDLIGSMKENIRATKWDEKTYEANVNTMTSDNYVIFIGDNKITKPMIKNMDVKFDKFGMTYGWLGKRAVMYVHTNIHRKETYQAFLAYVMSLGRKFEKVEKVSDKISDILGIDMPTGNFIKRGVAGGVGAGGIAAGVGLKNVLKKGAVRFLPGAFAGVGFATDALAIEGFVKEQERRKQQYTCLVIEMAQNGLKAFLGV